MDKLRYYESQLDKELSQYPIVNKLEKVTTVPKIYLFLGSSVVLTILVFFNIGGAFITTVLGWLIPAFHSLKALETKTKEDDAQWLTYWCVFGFFSTFEFLSPVILYLIPFYYFFKMVLILYLALPQYRGAEKLYTSTLRPVFLKLTSTVDDLVNDKISINEVVGEMRASAEAAAKNLEKSAAQAAGKASEKAAAAVGTVKENVGHAVGTVKENVGHAVGTVKENVGHAVETVKENATLAAESATNQASAAYGTAKDTVNSAVNTAEGKAGEVKDKTAEVTEDVKNATAEAVAEAENAAESKKDL